MTETGRWSDWIEHDGHGFPVPVGTLVRRWFEEPVELVKGEQVAPFREFCGPLRADELDSWLWVLPRDYPDGMIAHVVRYQVCRFEAMDRLTRLADIPAREEVTA